MVDQTQPLTPEEAANDPRISVDEEEPEGQVQETPGALNPDALSQAANDPVPIEDDEDETPTVGELDIPSTDPRGPAPDG